MPEDGAHALQARLGEDLVALGDAIPARNRQDWSGLPPVRPLALVRPRSTADVAAALAACSALDLPVVPQGGLTGLAGAAHPSDGTVALSLERMTAVGPVDATLACVTVEAGATLQAVQAAAEAGGMIFPVDLGARGSCTVGGNLSTNAGGIRVIRYGMARAHVLGLEAVLADGTVLKSMNRMLKNNAGYDLKQLFLGSEGTLGIITRAVLRLQPRPRFSTAALCGCRDVDAALDLLRRMRDGLGPTLSAFEAMWPSFYETMSAGLPTLPRPLRGRHGLYVVIEASGFDPENEPARLEAVLGAAIDAGVVEDAVLAQSEREVADLWALRESVSDFQAVMGPVANYDVGVPAGETGALVEALEAGIARQWPGLAGVSFGHLGDGNLHFTAQIPGGDAGDHDAHVALSDFVYRTTTAHGGTISAEHGIGTLKKPWLDLARSPAEIALMRSLKVALDPKGILNPGKVL
ncbi:FAD-binding oxidoreductase [Mangrovibrevibacter kandeliae]|uniref:FAD-binding oxidoreductase n=1 Tax=Mangrovibrevibacter kandeliae TaxID=2968473 RepID=UPI002119B1D6|nr:FAD-binding oxidoreductase [Aurantimonas sp. CSK15Z-1]MCQ8784027.1 FAD-binding oxidoreductase [Aurantimonas sp. CSK15Z-1]